MSARLSRGELLRISCGVGSVLLIIPWLWMASRSSAPGPLPALTLCVVNAPEPIEQSAKIVVPAPALAAALARLR